MKVLSSKFSCTFFIFFWCLFKTCAFSAQLFVPGQYPTIQDAIDAAQNNDEIILADGTYSGEKNRNINLPDKDLTFSSQNGPQNTIIDLSADVYPETYRAFYIDSAQLTLNGLTIQFGYDIEKGGAIFCTDANLSIHNCAFKYNSVYSLLRRNSFGGVIYAENSFLNINSSYFTGNLVKGGGTSSSNGYDGLGGVIYGDSNCEINIYNCLFDNNSALGGPVIDPPGVEKGSGLGGAIHGNANIRFSTFANNAADTSGGAIFSSETTDIENSILWANLPDQYSGSMQIDYSDVQQEITPGGEGNINQDPLFVTGPLGNYYLSQTAALQTLDSPCLNAGEDTATFHNMIHYTTRTDHLPDTAIADIGYHYQLNQPQKADINNDNIVNYLDYQCLSRQWLQSPSEPSADIYPYIGNNFIDIDDAIFLVDNWLYEIPSPPPLTHIGHWTFDEIQGTIAYDSTDNQNHGILINNPLRTSGYLDRCLFFDGINDYVQIPHSPELKDNLPLTITGWINIASDATGYMQIVQLDQVGNYLEPSYGPALLINVIDDSNMEILVACYDGGPNTSEHKYLKRISTSYYPGYWMHIAGVIRGKDNIQIYFNGENIEGTYEGSGNSLSYSTSGPMTIGAKGEIGQNFHGMIDDVRVYNYALKEGEVKQITGNIPAPRSLVGHWKLNETDGIIAFDSTEYQNNANLVNGPVWTEGKIDNALWFDGLEDTLQIPATAVLKPQIPLTMTAWIKIEPGALGHMNVIQLDQIGDTGEPAYGPVLSVNVIDDMTMEIRLAIFSGNSQNSTYTVAQIPYSAGQWMHITGVVYSFHDLLIYVNGIMVEDYTQGHSDGMSYSPEGNMTVGSRGGQDNFFHGSIDDIQLFNYAITEEDIRQLTGLATTPDSQVGRWEFNETSGTVAQDSTVYNNDGTLLNGPTWQEDALHFDGIDDMVEIPASAALKPELPLTMAAWINIEAGAIGYMQIMQLDHVGIYNENSYGPLMFVNIIDSSKMEISVAFYDGGPNNTYNRKLKTQTVFYTPNQWMHVAGIIHENEDMDIFVNGINVSGDYHGSGSRMKYSPTGSMSIGSKGDIENFFKGLIDDVRLFNYALDSLELQQLLVQMPEPYSLIGHWMLDETEGITAHDSSGLENNGTLYYGPAWTEGKINNSLWFDGIDDTLKTYSTPALKPNLPLTMTAWVRIEPGAIGWMQVIQLDEIGWYSEGNNYGALINLNVLPDDTMTVTTSIFDGGPHGSESRRTKESTLAFVPGEWMHLAAVIRSATDMDLYANGINIGGTYTGSGSGNLVYSPTGPMSIGSKGGLEHFFHGKIDDVRVYNYDLTHQEIQDLVW